MKTYIVQFRRTHDAKLEPLGFEIRARSAINAIRATAVILGRNLGADAVEIVVTEKQEN